MVFRDYKEFITQREILTQKYRGKFGCIVDFNGFVREYDLIEGKEVSSKGMSIGEKVFEVLENLRNEAISKYGLIDVLIYHNTGNLEVGDRVTGISIFARHRKEAFLALEFLINEIKKYH